MSREFVIHTLIEFGPLGVFFVAAQLCDFYTAVLLLVVSVVLALSFSIIHDRRFPHFSFYASLVVFVGGVMTLTLHDPIYIVVEYTISNIAFGIILLLNLRSQKTPLLKKLFGHMFQITDKGWNIITRNWGLLFICTGISNQLFWHVAHSEDDWIIFRVIVTLMLFLFSISQLLVSKQERLPHASAWGLKKN